MTDIELITIVMSSLSIIAGSAGWGILIYNWVTSKPKIRGQIYNVIIGDTSLPDNPNKTLTAFLVYLYLTNARKNTVHIIDYELEVDTGAGYGKMLRAYGARNIESPRLESPNGPIQIPDFSERVIWAGSKPIEYGVPLHGFALFASDTPSDQFKGRVKKYKVTCVDAFQGRHKIESKPTEFPNIYLWEELSGIKLPPRKQGGGENM